VERADDFLAANYLMMAREAGDWQQVTNLGKRLNLSLYFIDKTYNEAMRWAHQVTNEIRP